MTHNEKLDAILHALLFVLSIRAKKRVGKEGIDDEKLTMESICIALFEKKGHEEWETNYLERRLLSDGYIEFNSFEGKHLPEITNSGIKFIQEGGYKAERLNKDMNNELLKQNLKIAKRSGYAFFISIAAVIISALSFLRSL